LSRGRGAGAGGGGAAEERETGGKLSKTAIRSTLKDLHVDFSKKGGFHV